MQLIRQSAPTYVEIELILLTLGIGLTCEQIVDRSIDRRIGTID